MNVPIDFKNERVITTGNYQPDYSPLQKILTSFSQKKRAVLKISFIILVLLIIPLTLIQLKRVQDQRSKANSDQISFSFSPDSQTHGKGMPFPVEIYIDTSGEEIDLVNIKITFDKNTLRLDQFTPAKNLDYQVSSNNILPSDQGSFSYYAVDTLGQPIKGRVLLGTLIFTAIKGGQGLLKIDKVEIGNNENLTTISNPPMASITIIDPDESLSSTAPQAPTATPLITAGLILSPTIRVTGPSSTPVITSATKQTLPSITTSLAPTKTPIATLSPTQSQDSPLDKLFKHSSTSECTKKSIGDANCDGKVDRADIAIWKQELDQPGDMQADFNKDKKIDLLDYLVWRMSAFKS